MHNVWTIFKREYLERVRTKAFWITTLLVPGFMFAVTVLPSKLAMSQRGGQRHIAIVASDAGFAEAIRDSLARNTEEMGSKYQTDIVTPGTEEQKQELTARVAAGTLDGYLWATGAVLAQGKVIFNARSTSDLVENGVLRAAVKFARMKQQLGAFGVSGEKVDDLLRERLEMDTNRIEAGKEAKTSGRAAFFSAFFLVMTLYMSIIFHGIAVMRSVLEEKSSRIVEVLLSSVTAKELMAGKILGVGAVGLSQVTLWYGAGALVAAPVFLQAKTMMGGTLQLSAAAIIFFPVFYLLGYFLYATLWAMLGAMVNSEQEAQQLQFVVMLPLILSTVMMAPAIMQPNSPMVVAFSLFPFCTPLLMYLRIAVQQPPMWQIVLSVGLLIVTIYGLLVVCSRIYRVGILMYGKRPTLPELVKWFKYA